MKKPSPHRNIKTAESVKLTQEDYFQAHKVEENPAAMLRLIDLIFGPGEDKNPPS